MRQGDLVAGRFDVEALAAAGGMGQVFRARDRETGEPVAVKVLLGDTGAHAARFTQEARTLAELSHPGIVRYVSHGATDSGQPYLAMEWLDGEDLSRRLDRGGLTIEESLVLAARVADVLGAVHARGIVHRDLKPSNIFLVGKHIGQVKVLDFGIARIGGATRVTRTGAIIGTPGYMAPEQAQSDRMIDARADVFSLGCVLFECLTGAPAFAADHLMALLAKVLFAKPPQLLLVRPEAPVALDHLLSRMLAKDPVERPCDGAAVAEALAALGREGVASGASKGKVALTSGERRTMSVVLIEADPAVRVLEDRTLDQADADAVWALSRGAEAFGGRLMHLWDGSVAVSLEGVALATDQAAQAARCALWLRENAGERAVALATGRSEVTGGRAAAEAIDRAAKLLLSSTAVGGGGAVEGPLPVALDEMTARLLDGRFDVREGERGLSLHGERVVAEGARLLLNKPTACVGRDRELSTLTQMFAECVEEPLAQAVLLIGPAGIGKSRITKEFLARLRERGERMTVWIGRGDSLRAGSSLGLLGQALRDACGIRGDEPLPARREKLLAHVASQMDASERQRVAELLGEMVGAPFPDDESVLLRTARRNAQIMTDEMRRAWVDFLRAETAAQPVLLVLEDLHWGDGATVQFVDAALRDLGDRPWMVVAPARPEVHEAFPKLWTTRRIQEIQIPQLGKKASERLARQVLGDEVGAETMERLIAQADGNVFYLEELIRATAEHRGEGLPETVVAMVQSRLAALDDEDRRLLRAAAVFGEVFWPGGVAALLGRADRAAQVESRLLGLVEREVLVRRRESRPSGEVDLAFRHVLLREGAYAMLTEEDRVLGHRLAGEWLEQVEEREPKLLAEHFDRGGEGARAAAYYLRAAEQAHEGGDCEAAIRLSARGLALDPMPEVVAGLYALEGEARLWSGDFEGAFRAAEEALRVARPGSRTEGRALSAMMGGALYLRTPLWEPLMRLLHTDPDPDAIAMLAASSYSVIKSLLFTAQRDMAERYLRRIEQVTAGVIEHDPIAMAWVELARCSCACHIERDPWGYMEHAQAAMAHYKRSGTASFFPWGHLFLGGSYWYLGLFDQAEEEFALALATATDTERINVESFRFRARLDQRRVDEASTLAAQVAREAESRGNKLHCLTSGLCLAEVHLYKGALEAAESEALALSEIAEAEPYVGMWYLAVLASIRLAQGRAAEAREIAARALARSRACGMGHVHRHAMLLLVHAEAHHALGDRDAACQAIREAEQDLRRRAAKIPDPSARRSFLENIPDHRRTIELAREWLGKQA